MYNKSATTNPRVSQVGVQRGAEALFLLGTFREVGRKFFTAFCLSFLVSSHRSICNC